MRDREALLWIVAVSVFAVEANRVLGFDGFFGPCVALSAVLCGFVGVARAKR